MKEIVCYFDGACWPKNPGGIMGWGYHISVDGQIIQTGFNGKNASAANSNNVAEYLALRDCLDWLVCNNLSKNPISIFGDSQLVVLQMSGKWKIKNGMYRDAAIECKKLLCHFPNISFQWVARNYNELADELSNQGVSLYA